MAKPWTSRGSVFGAQATVVLASRYILYHSRAILACKSRVGTIRAIHLPYTS